MGKFHVFLSRFVWIIEIINWFCCYNNILADPVFFRYTICNQGKYFRISLHMQSIILHGSLERRQVWIFAIISFSVHHLLKERNHSLSLWFSFITEDGWKMDQQKHCDNKGKTKTTLGMTMTPNYKQEPPIFLWFLIAICLQQLFSSFCKLLYFGKLQKLTLFVNFSLFFH